MIVSTRPSTIPAFSLSLGITLLLACSNDDSTVTEPPGSASEDTGMDTGAMAPDVLDPVADPDAVIAAAAAYETDYVKINAEPFESQHGLADTVNVYVPPEHAELYRSIDPGMRTDVGFPAGAVIVKEHLDASGANDGFLLMVKAAEGYDPEAADWWWARVDGAGMTQETGQVGFCIDCHAAVSPTGFVFGVPTDNRL